MRAHVTARLVPLLVGALVWTNPGGARGAPPERDAVDALVAELGTDPPRDALDKLAAEHDLDPWLVAERLRAVATPPTAIRYVEALAAAPASLAAYLRGAAPLAPDAVRDAVVADALAFLAPRRAGTNPSAALREAARTIPEGSLTAIQLRLLAARCQAADGDLDGGLPGLEQAAQAAMALGWTAGARSALVSTLRAAQPAGRLAVARRAAERLAGLQTEERDVQGLATTSQDLAQISHLMGDTGGAVRQLAEAIDAYEQLGLGAQAERARQTRLIWYAMLGQFEAAAEDHHRIRADAEARGDGQRLALLDLDWANVLWLLGDHPRALAFADAALKAFEAQGSPRYRGLALGTKGNVLLQAGRWAESRSAHEQALLLLASAGDALPAAQARVGIAEALLEAVRSEPAPDAAGAATEDRLGLARASAQAAVDAFGQAAAVRLRLSAQETLAKVLDAAGSPAEGRALLEEILAQCQALALGRLALTCRLDLARLLAASGHWDEASRQALDGLAALNALEGAQAQQLNDRAALLRADLHDVGAQAGARRAHASMLHTFLEHGRAVALLAAMGGRSTALRATVDPLLRSSLEAARAAKVDALGRYLEARTKIGGGADARWAEYLQQRDGEMAVLRRVQAQEATGSARLAPQRVTTLDELRTRLTELSTASEPAPVGRTTVYVAFNLQANVGHALVLTPAEARVVLFGAEELAQLRAALATLLASLVPHDEDVPPTPDAAALRAIADTLLPPLRLPEGPVRLLISPDRELAFVPFALVLPERIRPVFVPSATVLDVLMRTRFATGTGVLACGDPDYKVKDLEGRGVALRGAPRLLALRNSRAEVEAVTPDRTVDGRLLGQAFTERGLARALTDGTAGAPPGPPRRRRALLLSCHGLLDVERPALSALALTPGDGEDGYLTAVEVLRLPVHADLVVLSACQTGRGRFVRGEGVMGLARAFMHAGAPRVVVSLWNVDDEATAFLMARLHELWRTGKVGLSDALQQAQRLTREHVFERTVAPAGQPARAEKKAWWADPAYWAPWVIWGLPD